MTARLTFPAYDIGAADILAGGGSVGFCLDEGGGTRGRARRWRAYLYPAPQAKRAPRPPGCEEVMAGTLADLRRELRQRVEREGPWWAG